MASTHHRLTGQERAGAAARVESHHPLLGGDPHDGEHVTPDACHHGLDHIEHGGGGHGGIDRIAAALEHGQSGTGSEGLAAGDDAIRCIDGGAAGHGAGPVLLGMNELTGAHYQSDGGKQVPCTGCRGG